MCSNDGEDGVELMERKKVIEVTASICKKCTDEQVPANVLLRGKDTYCRDCLIKNVSHKFRAALGKSKMIKRGDRVLIGFSGSQASVALVNLVKEGLAEASHKKLLFEPCIVYIDDGAALSVPIEDRRETLEEVKNLLCSYNFPSYISVLQMVTLPMSTNNCVYYSCHSEINIPDDDSSVTEMFSKIQDLSSKEDLLQKLRENVLVNMAVILGCCKVFTAETSNDLALRLLSNISLGRGSQLVFDVGFCDTRNPEVKILRPLKDLTKKEVTLYNVFKNLQSVHVPSFRTFAAEQSSIQKLTEKFLTELQDDFPSTTSTVFRTGEKLSSFCSEEENLEKCFLCKAPVDTSEIVSSSLQATNFSRLVSKHEPGTYISERKSQENAVCSETDTQNYNHSSSSKGTNKISIPDFDELLCYSCQLIFKDLEPDNLPLNLEETVNERLGIYKMQELPDYFS